MRKSLLLLALVATPLVAEQKRIVSIGGGVSEIVCALGQCSNVVAVDTSSHFPESLKKLPQVGYARSLSAEGIVAQKPTVLLLSEEAGPPDAIRKLEALKLPIHKIGGDETIEGVSKRIQTIGAALGDRPAADKLVEQLKGQLAELDKDPLKKSLAGKRVLFIYARGGKHIMMAGRKTAVDSLLKLVGVQNAGDSVEGFGPLTAEAVIGTKPDIILMTEAGAQGVGGKDAVFALPGLKATPAAAKKNLVMDEDLRLLTFGPRTPEVVKTLRKAFREAK